MEERTPVFTTTEPTVPVPKDLDDLIFQGECWLASDR